MHFPRPESCIWWRCKHYSALQQKTIEKITKNLLLVWYLQQTRIENSRKPIHFWCLQLKTIGNSKTPLFFIYS